LETQNQTDKIKINTIVLSDIHLGSEVSRPRKVLETLSGYRFNRLILLGDIFDNLNFARLKKPHWNLLSYIRRLSNPKNRIDVIWVEGNHDEGLTEVMSHLIGIKVYKEYRWRVNGEKFLAIHGHQFDRFLNENVVISNMASFIYDKIQKWGKEKQTLARYLKNKSKGWLRLSNKISEGAAEYGRHRKIDKIICGHTHKASERKFSDKNIDYYNTGCWTDIPCSYLIINDNAETEIKYVE